MPDGRSLLKIVFAISPSMAFVRTLRALFCMEDEVASQYPVRRPGKMMVVDTKQSVLTLSCYTGPKVDVGLDFQEHAHVQSTQEQVVGLLTDARSVLEEDHEIACTFLMKAIALLRQSEPLCIDKTFKGGLTRWQINRLKAYIDDNLRSKIRTADLAATLGLSVSHFSRSFKQANDISPQAFIMRRRIAAACAMMLGTNQPLTTIAHLHGFCDQSHFNRVFIQEIGTAPQAWRRINRAACSQ
jgi:AraC family transcriptional regulator